MIALLAALPFAVVVSRSVRCAWPAGQPFCDLTSAVSAAIPPLPAALGAHTAEEMRDQFGVRYTLRRDQFSGRLVRLLFFLGVDLAVNCLADGAHYCSIWAPGTFAPGDYYAPLVPDIVFMLTTIIARTAVRRGPASVPRSSTERHQPRPKICHR